MGIKKPILLTTNPSIPVDLVALSLSSVLDSNSFDRNDCSKLSIWCRWPVPDRFVRHRTFHANFGKNLVAIAWVHFSILSGGSKWKEWDYFLVVFGVIDILYETWILPVQHSRPLGDF
jgi:hypothetical protein